MAELAAVDHCFHPGVVPRRDRLLAAQRLIGILGADLRRHAILRAIRLQRATLIDRRHPLSKELLLGVSPFLCAPSSLVTFAREREPPRRPSSRPARARSLWRADRR